MVLGGSFMLKRDKLLPCWPIKPTPLFALGVPYKMTTCSMPPSWRTARLTRLIATSMLISLTFASAPAWAESSENQVPEQASSQSDEAPAEEPAPPGSDETPSDMSQTAPEEKGSAVGAEEAEALIVEVPSVAEGSPEPIEPPPTRELHLVLDWYPSLHHAAVLIAKAHGELKRQGSVVDHHLSRRSSRTG